MGVTHRAACCKLDAGDRYPFSASSLQKRNWCSRAAALSPVVLSKLVFNFNSLSGKAPRNIWSGAGVRPISVKRDSGRHALARRLSELGHPASRPELDFLYHRFMKLAESKKTIIKSLAGAVEGLNAHTRRSGIIMDIGRG